MITLSATIGTTDTTFFQANSNTFVTLSTLHVSNAGIAGVFTLYVKPFIGAAVPISKIDQAIDANGVAVCADPIVLSPGASLYAIADNVNMSVLMTGIETKL